jgi:hypothetical protein
MEEGRIGRHLKRSGLHLFAVSSWNLCWATEEDHRISQDNRCPDQDSNRTLSLSKPARRTHLQTTRLTVKLMIIIFWEMTPCGSHKNRRFGGSYRLHIQGERVRAGTERNGKLLYRRRLEEYEAIRSSETSVLIRATRRHLPEADNHHSHRRGNLKSYTTVKLSWLITHHAMKTY